MTLDKLREALEALEDRSWCEGTSALAEPLAIALPDGDLGAVDDPKFVDWLLAHAEVAPFGDGQKTKVDPKVRQTRRLVARGAAMVGGFDPKTILGEIEAALSPRTHLEATLSDVLVYPAGGHFARHKDTPRGPDLVGTLIVGLPIAHTGGAFHLRDGIGERVVDWSGPASSGTVRWVALFGDVDHEIKRVESGARVTLVYALTTTDRPREDPAREQRYAGVRSAIDLFAVNKGWMPEGGTLMVACTRQVVTGASQVQPIDTLRGSDREIAELFVAAGFKVSVRTCVAATPNESSPPPRFPNELYDVARLARELTPKIVASMGEAVSFSDDAEDDEGEAVGVTSLAPYILEDNVPYDAWLVRPNAAATVIHEALFSADGYFGNEHYDAYIYTLAALEVTRARLN